MRITVIFFLVFSGLSFPCSLLSQNKSGQEISGRIVDSSGNDLPYATVVVIDGNGKAVSFGVCGQDGNFAIKAVPAGRYRLEVSSVGCEPGRYEVEITSEGGNIGTFTLREGVSIDAVVVSPSIVAKVDRLVYNIRQKDENKSVLDILDSEIPFVTVDKATGNISVFGDDKGFSILVNGKKSLLLSEVNQYVAETLKGGNIKNIELILNPDGKYTDQTAVINFNTGSSLPDGIAGVMSAGAGTMKNHSAGVGVTSKIGKFIYGVDYSYRKAGSGYGLKNWGERIDYDGGQGQFMNSYRSSVNNLKYHDASLRASCDITASDLLSVRVGAKYDPYRDVSLAHEYYRDASGQTTKEYFDHIRNAGHELNLTGSIDYQRTFLKKTNRLLTVTYNFEDITNDTEYEKQLDAVTGVSDSHVMDTRRNGNREHTLAVDFYDPIGSKQNYYITAKYIYRNYNVDTSTRDLLTPESGNNPLDDMNFIQQVASLTANYTVRGKKTMFTSQFTLENTRDEIDFRLQEYKLKRNDLTLLPRFDFTYRPNSKSSVSLTLNKRVFRPDIIFLNPYEEAITESHVKKGNPDLENEKKYIANARYTYFVHRKFNLTMGANYIFSDNHVEAISSMNAGGIMVTTWDNIGRYEAFGFRLSLAYTPSITTRFILTGSINRSMFRMPDQRNIYWDPFMSFLAMTNLWKGASLTGSVLYSSVLSSMGMGISGAAQSSGRHYNIMADFSLVQNFGEHFRVSLNIVNPWEKYQRIISEIDTPNFYNYLKAQQLSRSASFAVAYHFGRFKESVKSGRRAVRNTDRKQTE